MKKGEAFSDIAQEFIKDMTILGSGGDSVDTGTIDLAPVTAGNGFFNSIVLSMIIGENTLATITSLEFKLEHSYNGTDYDAVTKNDIIGPIDANGVRAELTDGVYREVTGSFASYDDTVLPVCYVGGRQYIKGTVTTATPTSGTLPMMAILVKMFPYVGKATERYPLAVS